MEKKSHIRFLDQDSNKRFRFILYYHAPSKSFSTHFRVHFLVHAVRYGAHSDDNTPSRGYGLGTIQILRKHWSGWVGSEIGHFCLRSVHSELVGGLENLQKYAYVIFEWSPMENAKVMYSMSLSLGGCRALAYGEQAWSELDNRIM